MLSLGRRICPDSSLILIVLVALGVAFIPAPTPPTAPADRHIHVDAASFAYSPSVISVNPGDRVTLEFSSTDVVHGLYLDGYGLSLTAEPGQTARLTFTADRPGSFRFRCSVTCGPLHPFMIGKLNVGPNWLLYRAIGLAMLAALSGLLLAMPYATSRSIPLGRNT